MSNSSERIEKGILSIDKELYDFITNEVAQKLA